MCLVLEVGKVYVDSEGDKVKIIADLRNDRAESKFPYVGVYINPYLSTHTLQFDVTGCGKRFYDSTDQPAPLIKAAPTPHPHAKSMMLYAQDAAETDKPWLRWECTCDGMPNPYTRHWDHPMEFLCFNYRRLPQSEWPPEAC